MYRGESQCVERLLKAGASCDVETVDGTPLLMAACYGGLDATTNNPTTYSPTTNGPTTTNPTTFTPTTSGIASTQPPHDDTTDASDIASTQPPHHAHTPAPYRVPSPVIIRFIRAEKDSEIIRMQSNMKNNHNMNGFMHVQSVSNIYDGAGAGDGQPTTTTLVFALVFAAALPSSSYSTWMEPAPPKLAMEIKYNHDGDPIMRQLFNPTTDPTIHPAIHPTNDPLLDQIMALPPGTKQISPKQTSISSDRNIRNINKPSFKTTIVPLSAPISTTVTPGHSLSIDKTTKTVDNGYHSQTETVSS